MIITVEYNFFSSNFLGFGYCVFHLELIVHHTSVPVHVCVSFVCFILILEALFTNLCVLISIFISWLILLPNYMIEVALVYIAFYFCHWIQHLLQKNNSFIKSARTQHKLMYTKRSRQNFVWHTFISKSKHKLP